MENEKRIPLEQFKDDAHFIMADMAKIEAYIELVSNNKDAGEVFGSIDDEIISHIKTVDEFIRVMSTAFTRELLARRFETDNTLLDEKVISDLAEISAALDFLNKRMKVVKAKHAIYYFNKK